MLFMGTEKYPDENEYSNVIFILLSSSLKTQDQTMPIHLKNKQIISWKSQAMYFNKLLINLLSFLLLL